MLLLVIEDYSSAGYLPGFGSFTIFFDEVERSCHVDRIDSYILSRTGKYTYELLRNRREGVWLGWLRELRTNIVKTK